MTSLLTAYLILVPAPANEPEPTGAAPTLQYVRFNDKGIFEQTVTVVKYTPVTKSVVVNVNGQMQVRTVTEVVPTYVTEKRLIDAKNYEFYDLDGKKLDESDWRKALAAGAVVAVAGDNNLPHATYRKALKGGTIVLVPKQSAPAPVPAPAKTPALP